MTPVVSCPDASVGYLVLTAIFGPVF
uniref:Uncharacterized protein n=1 Tax=Anguilla anguilla TaxID=7936 RepID=A0A0E9UG89_ANGAN